MKFLSTLSLRRATRIVERAAAPVHISIHALLAESDFLVMWTRCPSTIISIHALLAESDHNRRSRKPCHLHFYPRSPCGERRFGRILSVSNGYFYPRSPCGERQMQRKQPMQMLQAFLSTLSLRRATSALIAPASTFSHFYPRSPCGERRQLYLFSLCVTAFLSTLSLRRATICPQAFCACFPKFLSTLSLRRATR